MEIETVKEKSARKPRWVLLLAALTAGGVVIGAMYLRFTYTPLRTPPVPDIQTLQTQGDFDYAGDLLSLTGKIIPVSAFQDRVLFINVWASWCPPCRAEMPNLVNLFQMFREDPEIAALFISAEDIEKVRRFMSEHNYRSPAFIADVEWMNRNRIQSLPTTIVVNRAGKIVYRHSGAARWDDPIFAAFLTHLKK